MSGGLWKEKEGVNQGGVGQNLLTMGRQLLLHQMFFPSEKNITHFECNKMVLHPKVKT